MQDVYLNEINSILLLEDLRFTARLPQAALVYLVILTFSISFTLLA